MHGPDEQNPMQTIWENIDLRELVELETSLWIQAIFRFDQPQSVHMNDQ